MALGVACFLQTQKKPAVLYNFLLETMSYVKSNLSRIRIAACNLAGEQAGLLDAGGTLKTIWSDPGLSGTGVGSRLGQKFPVCVPWRSYLPDVELDVPN